ncbi:DNA topoisomerase 1-like [Saccostrea echinata]|uniref:DNA topoisomerase 1-like n=1 Tax=Saccostrea echinata TaxID=191078 RepID=UPI002A7F8FB0|nr:DNA topoisomerase 1-like [Saccostrea echinata]
MEIEEAATESATPGTGRKATRKTATKKTATKKSATKTAAGKTSAARLSTSIPAGKKLLIVESPAKARTLSKFLGSEFQIKASVGHVRDLPQKGNSRKGLGIDVEHDFRPDYQIIPGKEKTVQELKACAARASEIFLAPDPDREGESIAWHLAELLEVHDKPVHRVSYGAITRKAVQEAIARPRSINMDLVNAQQGRRVLDRLVGFELSPFLWKKVAMRLSAGRVQSVAVRLVVAREKQIRAFVPEEYWRLLAVLEGTETTGRAAQFSAELTQWRGERFALGRKAASCEEEVRKVLAVLDNACYTLEEVQKKETRRKAPAPFITSTLQQSASNMFSFGPSRTMGLAQKLYEGVEIGNDGPVGLITYMRTDSTRIEPEAIAELRSYIESHFPGHYLEPKARVFGSQANAQDAHEAIRPTSVALTPELLRPYLERDSHRLYTMIWNRFVASQMSDARYALTTFRISARSADSDTADGLLESRGRIMIFDGFTRLWNDNSTGARTSKTNAGTKQAETATGTAETEKTTTDEQLLPDIAAGSLLEKKELQPAQHFTRPPNRYTEAGLVKALEKEGIGRPSTYAPIIRTIRERGYVALEQRSFRATELGIAVTEVLEKNFPDIMDLRFTAGMEQDLDKIEQGQIHWVQVMTGFYGKFHEQVVYASEHAETLKGRPYEGSETCPLCQSSMVLRYSRNGAFLSCSQYPDCKGLRPMPGEGESSAGQEPVDCPNCGRLMIVKTSRFGQKFLACSGYPECRTTQSIAQDGSEEDLPEIDHDCEDCGKPMLVKTSRFGKKFLACSSYPDCKNTHPLDAEGNIVFLPRIRGEVCEKCGSEMQVKMGRRGPFLACSGYPKCRNARPLPGEEPDTTPRKKVARKKTAAKKTTAKKLWPGRPQQRRLPQRKLRPGRPQQRRLPQRKLRPGRPQQRKLPRKTPRRSIPAVAVAPDRGPAPAPADCILPYRRIAAATSASQRQNQGLLDCNLAASELAFLSGGPVSADSPDAAAVQPESAQLQQSIYQPFVWEREQPQPAGAAVAGAHFFSGQPHGRGLY